MRLKRYICFEPGGDRIRNKINGNESEIFFYFSLLKFFFQLLYRKISKYESIKMRPIGFKMPPQHADELRPIFFVQDKNKCSMHMVDEW